MAINEDDFHIKTVEYMQYVRMDDIKWITGTKYHFQIKSDFQEHAQFKRWCLENCNGPVVFIEHALEARSIDVYMFSEEDVVAAKLKWS